MVTSLPPELVPHVDRLAPDEAYMDNVGSARVRHPNGVRRRMRCCARANSALFGKVSRGQPARATAITVGASKPKSLRSHRPARRGARAGSGSARHPRQQHGVARDVHASYSLELVERGSGKMADPDREQAQREREADIGTSPTHLTIPDQVKGLQAER